MLIFFSIYFFFNFFIFPLLPGREKIRYHSITACIIQHWRANLICVCPTGLHPPCCNYCLFLLCIFDLKLSQWEGRSCISHKTNVHMNAWCFKCLYKGYTYMFHCCKSVYSLKAFAQEQVAMLRSVGSSRSPLA